MAGPLGTPLGLAKADKTGIYKIKLLWWFSGWDCTFSAGDAGLIPGLRRSLEEEMVTHSSILAWEIP